MISARMFAGLAVCLMCLFTALQAQAAGNVNAAIADMEAKAAECKAAIQNGADKSGGAFMCARACDAGINAVKRAANTPNASAFAARAQQACAMRHRKADLSPQPVSPPPAVNPRLRTRGTPAANSVPTDADRIAAMPEKAAYCAAQAPAMMCHKSFQTRVPNDKREACHAVAICQNYCSTPNIAADLATGRPYLKKQVTLKISGCERNWRTVRTYLGHP